MQNINYNDFTVTVYRELLKLAKKNFIFAHYTNFNQYDKFILWRHDVDFSLQRALALANIEAEEGLNATYFLHLHNEFYNLLEKSNMDAVRAILKLNHKIALHFDSHFYDITDETSLIVNLQFEKNLLESLFQCDIHAFSFHIPTPHTMNFKNMQYANLINTYASFFQEEVPYCSDSNGYWRFKSLKSVLSDPAIKCLQVLTHPAWWTEEPLSPFNRILRCVYGRAEKQISNYEEILRVSQRTNIK